ncbi:tRNA (adenine(22)-N(1))-methyltransferase [Floccifex sp.]|uniref:tRNA (adenine(22)-N(1))-methyltransferase n=1 Tax=Floccifex sp. TaxID=2815810 RepID=UPI002A761659|nr:class I SAM-dependent methyltransferase [Floccifex sp.]MDD7281391.1 class I SAM-dependent methyltransferase [Erysipelotrichaceae bacterium]MDY2958096.1 class I SAM-dependent methyltransferase [Floccifex sp.]
MISNRLQAIVDWIDGTVLADIGCDHGYVCIESILQNKVRKAYACDVAKGPLENASQTIQKYHLENQIECELMNGIDYLKEDVDIIVIAGMGASTIIDILTGKKLKPGMKLICSPHKDVESFRLFASQNGYKIIKEKVIYDEHFYSVIYLEYDGSSYTLSNSEYYYGLNVQRDDVFSQFIDEETKKWQRIYNSMPSDKRLKIEERLNAIDEIR